MIEKLKTLVRLKLTDAGPPARAGCDYRKSVKLFDNENLTPREQYERCGDEFLEFIDLNLVGESVDNFEITSCRFDAGTIVTLRIVT